MFYEMLTGRSAFPAPTEYARLAAVMTVEPEPVERVDPSLAPLGPFVARALKKNRADRFSSALEMARALVAAVPHAAASDMAGGALSRLPDVPSLLAPPGLGAGVPSTSSMRDPGAAPGTAASPGVERVGGTLASAAHGMPVTDPAPQVVVVPPATSVGGTLPSEGLPIIDRSSFGRGVPRGLVALLVVVALVTGFAFGWVFGRMP